MIRYEVISVRNIVNLSSSIKEFAGFFFEGHDLSKTTKNGDFHLVFRSESFILVSTIAFVFQHSQSLR